MTPVGLAVGKKEGGGKDDGAAVNGLLIFIEGLSQVMQRSS